MAYFRIITGLRGCYADSSTNDVIQCDTPTELFQAIDEALKFQTENDCGEELESDVDPCTPEQAESLFALYTRQSPPWLPTCAASWNGGAWGVLVGSASREEYQEQYETEF